MDCGGMRDLQHALPTMAHATRDSSGSTWRRQTLSPPNKRCQQRRKSTTPFATPRSHRSLAQSMDAQWRPHKPQPGPAPAPVPVPAPMLIQDGDVSALEPRTYGMNINAQEFVPWMTAPPPPPAPPPAPAPSAQAITSTRSSTRSRSPPGAHRKNTALKTQAPSSSEVVKTPATEKAIQLLDDGLKSVLEDLVEQHELSAAIQLAEHRRQLLPTQMHAKFYHELAGFIKRQNLMTLARMYYSQLVAIDPSSPNYWLEFARLEEEVGDWARCGEILHHALLYCESSSNLLLRLIKHEELVENINVSRKLLARVKTWPLKRSWKVILEGAMIEARAGNLFVSRKILKFMMLKLPQSGPILLEACLLEERYGNYARALRIAHKGIEMAPRYGLLWLAALRLEERFAFQRCLDGWDSVPNLVRVRALVVRCAKEVCHEFIWKIFLEYALMEQRVAEYARDIMAFDESHLQNCREAFSQALQYCPDHLTWKIWVGGARMELCTIENVDVAHMILCRAEAETRQTKNWFYPVLELARHAELTGELRRARELLATAALQARQNDSRPESEHLWKLDYERVALECRAGKFSTARVICWDALSTNAGVGRLWAMYIAINHDAGFVTQLKLFKKALENVPKSGEVWCEGARLHSNPFSPYFDLDRAEQFLYFASVFTPQFGDVFIEKLRIDMIRWTHHRQQGHLMSFERFSDEDIVRKCVNSDPKYGRLWLACKNDAFTTAAEVVKKAKHMIAVDLEHTWKLFERRMTLAPKMRDPAQYAHEISVLLRRECAFSSLLSSYHFTNGSVDDSILFWGLNGRQSLSRMTQEGKAMLMHQLYAQDPILS